MPDTAKIRELNDRFRRTFIGGKIMMTPGISERPDLACILTRVRTFETFDEDNNPYAERDFGGFEVNGETILWKVDYFDKEFCNGSPDPANESLTTRV